MSLRETAPGTWVWRSSSLPHRHVVGVLSGLVIVALGLLHGGLILAGAGDRGAGDVIGAVAAVLIGAAFSLVFGLRVRAIRGREETVRITDDGLHLALVERAGSRDIAIPWEDVLRVERIVWSGDGLPRYAGGVRIETPSERVVLLPGATTRESGRLIAAITDRMPGTSGAPAAVVASAPVAGQGTSGAQPAAAADDVRGGESIVTGSNDPAAALVVRPDPATSTTVGITFLVVGAVAALVGAGRAIWITPADEGELSFRILLLCFSAVIVLSLGPMAAFAWFGRYVYAVRSVPGSPERLRLRVRMKLGPLRYSSGVDLWPDRTVEGVVMRSADGRKRPGLGIRVHGFRHPMGNALPYAEAVKVVRWFGRRTGGRVRLVEEVVE